MMINIVKDTMSIQKGSHRLSGATYYILNSYRTIFIFPTDEQSWNFTYPRNNNQNVTPVYQTLLTSLAPAY